MLRTPHASAARRWTWKRLLGLTLLVALVAFPSAAGARGAGRSSDHRIVAKSPARSTAKVPKPPRDGGKKAPGTILAPSGANAPAGAAGAATSPVTYRQWNGHDAQGDKYVAIADQMNVCVYGDTQHSADISVPITVGNFGPVDAAGHPAPGNALYGKQGRISLVLYDVDDHANASPPEWDWLFFGQANPDGTTYEGSIGQLTGANDSPSTNFFSFSTDLIKPKSSVNPSGVNYVNVDVDMGDNGGTQTSWCVAVNEVILRLVTDPLPAVLIHGFTVDGHKMDSLRAYWEQNYPALVGKLDNRDYSKTGGMETRYATVVAAVNSLLQKTGQTHVNLVGHSFGGLTARYFTLLNPGIVDNVAMLGTPNGGTRLADIGCGYFAGSWLLGIKGEAVKQAIQLKTGPCTPGHALFEMQQPYMQTWDRLLPDPGPTKYYTFAGTNSYDGGALGKITSTLLAPDENDTWVPSKSVFWLRPGAVPDLGLGDNPDHPGNEKPMGKYFLVHDQLHEDPSPLDDSLCAVYPETCPNGVQPRSFARPSAKDANSPRWKAGAARLLDSLSDPAKTVSSSTEAAVPAGGTTDVPLTFEGSASASILIVSDQIDNLTGSFGATNLDVAEFFPGVNALGTTLSSPANGVLHLANSGGATANVIVLTNIDTARTLTLAAAPQVVRPNAPVTIDVSLSGASVGDSAHLTIADESGAAVAELDPTSTGTGTWRGTWTAPTSGEYSVKASVGGSAPRQAFASFTVASGAATIATGFAEQTVDDNQNGLADSLLVKPSINVGVAGGYVLSARLADASGATVATASANLDLAAGTQAPTLPFDGRDIYASGKSGPYHVVDVTLSRRDEAAHAEDQVADLGATGAYARGSFEHDRVVLDASGFSDQGRDNDGDGLLDDLLVTFGVTVETAGDYTIYGELVDPNGKEVATRGAIATLAAGQNTITLAFFGTDIGRSGKNGPYRLASLELTSASDLTVDGVARDAYTTGAYTISQFAGADVTGSIVAGGAKPAISIPNANQYGRVTFSGTAGERVALVLSSSTIASGTVELRSPENHVIGSTPLDTTGGFIDTLPLPATGGYTIVVDPSGSGGSVTLALYDVPADASASTTVGGAAATATTTIPGQNAKVTFAGTLNQKITVKLTSTPIKAGSITLVRPDGVAQATAAITSTGAFIDAQTLTLAGTYTVRIDPAGSVTGASSVTVATAAGDVTGTIRAGGQAVTVTTATAGQNARLTFSGTLNQKVSIKTTSTAITSGTVYLLKPDGTTLASGAFTTSGAFVDTTALPVAGTYTILLDPAGTATGGMTTNLYTVADVTGTITAGGAAATSTTKTPGQNVRLTFSGTLNQRVSVKMTSTAITSGSVALLKPDGSTLASSTISSSGAFVDVQTLPVAGTYTVLVDPAGSVVGAVTTNLYNVNDFSGTITPNGAAVPVNLTVPGQNGKLTFTGAALDRISVNLTSSTISAATVKLVKPDASVLASTTIGTSGGSIPTQVLSVGGTYSVVVDPTGAATGSVTVTVVKGPADVTGTIVPGGSPLTATTTAADQNARITFSGTAGKRISLKLSGVTVGASTCCSAYVSVVNPDGQTNVVQPTFYGTSGLFVDTQTLGATGTYTILLDPQGTATGSTTLTLYDVPADDSGTIIAGGAPASVTTTVPGQNAKRTFGGTAGQRISLNITGVTISSMTVGIRNPDGQTYLVQPTSFGTSGGAIDLQTLGSTGTYAIEVDPLGAATGSATLTLNDIPPDDSGTITPGGAPVTVTTTVVGQNAVRTFAGTAGQRISLRIGSVTMGSSACCSTKVSIVNPGGQTNLVSPTYVGTFGGYLDVQTLPTTGTYSVLVDPQDTATGSATLSLFDVPPDDTGSITPGGSSVTVTAGTPGQNVKRTFTGVAGHRISLQVSNVTMGSSACCSTKVSIVNPDGSTNLVNPTSIGTFGGFIDVQPVVAGTYTILVDPQDDATGNATLSLFDVPPDNTGTMTPGGPASTVTISTPGQNAKRTFTGTAGRRISLKISGGIGTSACCSSKVSIVNPDGSTNLVNPAFVGSGGGFVDVQTVAAGTYTIVLDPQDTATGTATMTLYDVPADTAGSISVGGGSVVVTTSTPGQNATLTFTGSVGQKLNLALSNVTMGTSACCSTKISIKNPSGSTLVNPSYIGTFGGTITMTLVQAGTHTIVIDPQDEAVGSMSATLTQSASFAALWHHR